MSKRILLGIDSNYSSATYHALQAVREMLEQAPNLHLVLLNVIPMPSVASPSLGMYVSHIMPMSITPEQRTQAEIALHKARAALQKEGIASEQIDVLIRTGLPAEEIAKAAKELHVNFIVVGSRGDTIWQKLRRFLIGSTSRRVLHLAPCPVMIVPTPHVARPNDLVAWYELAITNYLREHPDALTIFTPQEVAQKFIPPSKKTPGRKEMAAATLALEQLTSSGVLCRHDIRGELRYVND